jgi:hypothetical protein
VQRGFRQSQGEIVPARFHERPHCFHSVLYHFAQLDGLGVQRELAARDSGNVEQIVDQPRQMLVLTREYVARPRRAARHRSS